MKPVSLAFRGMAFNRLTEAEDNNYYPFFIGSQGFVRGYGSPFSNFQAVAARLENQDVAFGQLIGGNIALFSTEIRLPFTGPRRLALIPSRFLLSDLALFFDVGTAYNNFSDFDSATKPYISMSTGITARINVL